MPLPNKPWPVPLPAWFWPWANWYLGTGEYKGLKFRDKLTRPATAPKLIPKWAWARLEALIPAGHPFSPPPPLKTPTLFSQPGAMFVNAVDPQGYGAALKRNEFKYAGIQVSTGLTPLNDQGLWSEGWQDVMRSFVETGAWAYFKCDDLPRELDLAITRAKRMKCTFFDANCEIGYKGDVVGAAAAKYRAELTVSTLRAAFGPDFPLGFSTYSRLDHETTIDYKPFIDAGFVCKPQAYWHLRSDWGPQDCFTAAVSMGWAPDHVAPTTGHGERQIGYVSPTNYMHNFSHHGISIYPCDAITFAELDEYGAMLRALPALS